MFLRFNARSYEPNRIELSSQFSEVERPPEKFSFSYLPEPVETMFREALQCYSHGAFNAFASMCRRTMQEAFAVLGESGKLRLFDELNDLREMAEIDAASFTLIKRVIFGTDADPAPSLPTLDDDQAGLLLEVMKDLLYQSYVRKGRLQQAMVMRRFFSEEAAQRTAARAMRTSAPSRCRRVAAALDLRLSRATRARCGTGASSHCPRRHRAGARNSAHCDRRAPGAACRS